MTKRRSHQEQKTLSSITYCITAKAMNAAQQLELFSKPAAGNIYRAGDWIKVKRKPAIAASIKRGECFEINAVHPKDGSVRIWNPHINQWDFLYPDEIKLTKSLTPSTVELVVGNVETSSTVELVVGNIELNKKDSGYNSNGWIEFHYKVRIDGKQHSVRNKQNKCTGPYYTYRWLEGRIKRAKYVTNKKMGEVYRAIATGQPTSEILKIISNPSRLDTILKK